jgi:hypothetical protein
MFSLSGLNYINLIIMLNKFKMKKIYRLKNSNYQIPKIHNFYS